MFKIIIDEKETMYFESALEVDSEFSELGYTNLYEDDFKSIDEYNYAVERVDDLANIRTFVSLFELQKVLDLIPDHKFEVLEVDELEHVEHLKTLVEDHHDSTGRVVYNTLFNNSSDFSKYLVERLHESSYLNDKLEDLYWELKSNLEIIERFDDDIYSGHSAFVYQEYCGLSDYNFLELDDSVSIKQLKDFLKDK